ncbi:ATP-dependent DNA helicase [Trichonephila clavipes]|nr:ATP-dependent DNA helicase [Trichonephila clavipes]
MKAVSVLEHFSDHGSIHQKMKKNATSVRSYPNSAGDGKTPYEEGLVFLHLKLLQGNSRDARGHQLEDTLQELGRGGPEGWSSNYQIPFDTSITPESSQVRTSLDPPNAGNSSTSSYFGYGIRQTHFATNTFHANSAIETCTRSVWNIRAEIINVPISINTMVNRLPQNVEDDYCVNVHIKRRKILGTSYRMGLVTKRTIKAWLQCLVATPLYRKHDVPIDDSFLNLNQSSLKFLKKKSVKI